VNGAIEEVSEDEFEPMFQTNIYGLIRVTRAFLPHFASAAADIFSICPPSAD